MTSEHLDWDNLRYFLAVARAGKLTAAARRLGQDHTTVGRRIASLESAFQSKLFERRHDGTTGTARAAAKTGPDRAAKIE